jgi:hypothetical protein
LKGIKREHLGWLIQAVVLASLLAGCSLGAGPASATAPASAKYEGMTAIPFDQYATRFTLEFEGETSWQYQLTTRRSGELLERELAIQGVDDTTRAPGDVRLVTSQGVTRMRGTGTKESCLQFPQAMSINVTLLSPDEVMPPDDFAQPLLLLGQEKVTGFQANHFVLRQDELDGWQQVELSIWISEVGDTVVRHEFQAEGWDPYFGAGYGQLNGDYEVVEVGQQQIEPIEGCQLELPLPDSAMNLVVLPEIISYSSEEGVEDIAAYYQQQLSEAGWRPLEQEDRSSGAVLLRYFKGGQQLLVSIRRFQDVTQVELFRP